MPKLRIQTTTTMDRRNAKMYEMSNKGANLADIGRLFGVTRERVRQVVNRVQKQIEGDVEAYFDQKD